MVVESLEAATTAGWAATIIEGYEADVQSVSAQAVIEHVDTVLALMRRAVGEAHIYVKCLGD